ncbi:hypothetical protein HPB52_025143 [Rhipicephalus sanguineus]|uniref:Uncharacterized protein n=1 Tax=Rhipicephalus sanguineus TaxID=34632 RepID=A0A9D4PA96_RHISA|nr:hypothetical protein HPB52_025143 [Rhipicephalus sanguineus]
MSFQEDHSGPSSSRPPAYPPEVKATPEQFRGRANTSAPARGGARPKCPKPRRTFHPQVSLEAREENPTRTSAELVLSTETEFETSTIEEIDPDQVDELIRHLNLLKQTINEDEEELELSRMRLKRDNNFLHKELAKQREKVHMLREARSADDQNARPPTYANPRSRRRGQRGGVLFASPASASSGHSEMAEGGQ